MIFNQFKGIPFPGLQKHIQLFSKIETKLVELSIQYPVSMSELWPRFSNIYKSNIHSHQIALDQLKNELEREFLEGKR